MELGRTVVHEPDEPDPVLSVIRQLQRELLADIAGADDHCVATITGQMSAQRARSRAERRDQDDCQEPEDSEPSQNGLHEVGRDPEEREHPDSDRDAAKDADDVVDGRVVGPLLVPVVEALEPEQQDPSGDREHERQVFVARADPVPHLPDRRDEGVRENEGEDEAHEVGGEEHPPDEGAAPIAAPRRCEDRPLVKCQLPDKLGRCVTADTPAVDSQALAHRTPPSRCPTHGLRPRRSATPPSPLRDCLFLAASAPYRFGEELQGRWARPGRSGSSTGASEAAGDRGSPGCPVGIAAWTDGQLSPQVEPPSIR